MSTPVAIYGAVNVNVHSPEIALQMKEMNGGSLTMLLGCFSVSLFVMGQQCRLLGKNRPLLSPSMCSQCPLHIFLRAWFFSLCCHLIILYNVNILQVP